MIGPYDVPSYRVSFAEPQPVVDFTVKAATPARRTERKPKPRVNK